MRAAFGVSDYLQLSRILSETIQSYSSRVQGVFFGRNRAKEVEQIRECVGKGGNIEGDDGPEDKVFKLVRQKLNAIGSNLHGQSGYHAGGIPRHVRQDASVHDSRYSSDMFGSSLPQTAR